MSCNDLTDYHRDSTYSRRTHYNGGIVAHVLSRSGLLCPPSRPVFGPVRSTSSNRIKAALCSSSSERRIPHSAASSPRGFSWLQSTSSSGTVDLACYCHAHRKVWSVTALLVSQLYCHAVSCNCQIAMDRVMQQHCPRTIRKVPPRHVGLTKHLRIQYKFDASRSHLDSRASVHGRRVRLIPIHLLHGQPDPVAQVAAEDNHIAFVERLIDDGWTYSSWQYAVSKASEAKSPTRLISAGCRARS